MRARRSVPIALAGGVALSLVATQPAAAAIAVWTSPTDSNWSTAAWAGTAPTTGDDVLFGGGPRSTYDLGDMSFSSLVFEADHEIANGGGAITLTSGVGLWVQDGVSARIEPLLTADADQVWWVSPGAELELPSTARTNGVDKLTLFVQGTMTVLPSGNLDALGTGCIVKTGSGTLHLQGGGGGVGVCEGYQGLSIYDGEVAIDGSPNLGGKDFFLVDGRFTGGTPAAAAVVRSLDVIGGIVHPGPNGGADIGHIDLWGASEWFGGLYQVDWDATTDNADLIRGVNQPIEVSSTRLDVRLAGTPTAGETIRILGSNVSFTGGFAAPDGTDLADGDEFTSNGQVYSISYTTSGAQSGVELTWLREAASPSPSPSVEPSVGPSAQPTGGVASEIADTGADDAAPLTALAVVAVGTGVALVVLGSRRRPARIR